MGANDFLAKIYLKLQVNCSPRHAEVKFSKYADEIVTDLSFSLNVNFFSRRSVKLLVILEYILEIVQKIVWLWE